VWSNKRPGSERVTPTPALLLVSAQQYPHSDHVALDITFFERQQASQYYFQQQNRRVKTIKTTTLTDTESGSLMDLRVSPHRGSSISSLAT
jgi:hypothetical protein